MNADLPTRLRFHADCQTELAKYYRTRAKGASTHQSIEADEMAADLRLAADKLGQLDVAPVHIEIPKRHANCLEQWPECFDGGYDPRCCRFPKSCSCDVRTMEVDR